MTSGQKCRNNMYMVVAEYLTTNATITTSLPNYVGFFTAFKSSTDSIQLCAEQQMFDKRGIAENKSKLRSNLILLAVDTSRKLTAFAQFTNNLVLLKEIRFTNSDLKRSTDMALRENTQGIYDRAQTNIAELVTYGITVTSQTLLQKAITNFETSIPKPRLGITEKKQSTTQLKNLFMSADKALINIDTVVEIIRLTQPNFYNGYKSARKLIETGNGSLMVKGVVTEAESGEPIKGASLSFVFDGKGGTQKRVKDVETRIKKTAKKGGFNIKSLPAGMYTVTIKKIGYADHVATIAVSKGDLAKLNIQLSKN